MQNKMREPVCTWKDPGRNVETVTEKWREAG